MLDADSIPDNDRSAHRSGPVDANSSAASLGMDNGAADADEDGTMVPPLLSADDEGREEEEEGEEKEEEDGGNDGGNEDDGPVSSEHESTSHSSLSCTSVPMMCVPPTSSQATIVTFCSTSINHSRLTCCSRTFKGPPAQVHKRYSTTHVYCVKRFLISEL